MKLLLAEDNAADVRIVRELLKDAPSRDIELQHAGTLGDVVERINHETFDELLLDLGLPDSQGIETLRTARAACGDIPIVVLTGRDDPELAISAVAMGAQDYLVKGQFNADVLLRTVRYAAERSRADLKIRHLAAIVDSSSEAIISSTLDGTIVSWNQGAERVYGYTAAEAIGRSFAQLLPTGRADEIVHLLGRLRRGERPDRFETRHRRKDGREITVVMSLAPIQNGRGDVVAASSIATDITEKKRAEEALRIAHSRIRSIIDTNIIGVLVARPDGRVTEANDYYLRLIGFSRRECEEGQVNWRAITPPEWLPADEKALSELAGKGTCTPYEKEYQRRDGTRVSVYLADAILPGSDGDIAAFALDLSERKAAEAALTSARQRLYDVLETLPAMICLVKPDYRVVFANRSLRQHFGEPEGRPCHEYCFARSSRCECCEAFSVLKTGQSQRWEVTARDGHVYEIFNFPFADTDGSRLLLEMDIDITDRKRAEREIQELNATLEQRVRDRTEQLRQSEERFKAIAANTPDHLVVQDLDLRYTLVVNPQLGLTEAEMLGKRDSDLLPGEDADRLTAIKRSVIASRQPCSLVTPLVSREGLTEYFEGSYVPKLNAQGEVDGVIGYFRNITDRRRSELQIRHLNATLQRRADELEYANKELEAFSYSVSHDLRAPLRSIDGFSRILLRDCVGQLEEKHQKDLQRVRLASQRMGELIDALLNLSRTTRADLHRIPLDLARIARGTLDELQRAEPARTVRCTLPARLPAVADPVLMRVVMGNLFSNAWKFTRQRADATIELGVVERDGKPAFFVRDNGVGFDMAYAEKLFAPFQRFHSASEFPGTGVGLATVQRIIRRHGGRIWVETAVDQGATFYFTLGEPGLTP